MSSSIIHPQSPFIMLKEIFGSSVVAVNLCFFNFQFMSSQSKRRYIVSLIYIYNKLSVRTVLLAETILTGGSFLELRLSDTNFFFCPKLRNNIVDPGKILLFTYYSYCAKYSKKKQVSPGLDHFRKQVIFTFKNLVVFYSGILENGF